MADITFFKTIDMLYFQYYFLNKQRNGRFKKHLFLCCFFFFKKSTINLSIYAIGKIVHRLTRKFLEIFMNWDGWENHI